MNLLHLFDLSLAARANEIALEWDGAEFTFGDIERRSNRVAHALRVRGLAKGDRLCVYLGNRIELIDIYLACVKLGVIFVPINILYRDREIAYITNDAEAKLTITEAELPRDPSTPMRWNARAAKTSHHSKCRAVSCRSIRSRARRWEKCRSISCRGENEVATRRWRLAAEWEACAGIAHKRNHPVFSACCAITLRYIASLAQIVRIVRNSTTP